MQTSLVVCIFDAKFDAICEHLILIDFEKLELMIHELIVFVDK